MFLFLAVGISVPQHSNAMQSKVSAGIYHGGFLLTSAAIYGITYSLVGVRFEKKTTNKAYQKSPEELSILTPAEESMKIRFPHAYALHKEIIAEHKKEVVATLKCSPSNYSASINSEINVPERMAQAVEEAYQNGTITHKEIKDSIGFVVRHELGHIYYHHVCPFSTWQPSFANTIGIATGLRLAAHIAFPVPSTILGALAATAVLGVGQIGVSSGLPVGIINNYLARRQERQADDYAIKHSSTHECLAKSIYFQKAHEIDDDEIKKHFQNPIKEKAFIFMQRKIFYTHPTHHERSQLLQQAALAKSKNNKDECVLSPNTRNIILNGFDKSHAVGKANEATESAINKS